MEKEREIRCGHCGRLLAKGTAASVSIKCPRCGVFNQIILSAVSASADSQEPPQAVKHEKGIL
jgi:phage FluMu protein Com